MNQKALKYLWDMQYSMNQIEAHIQGIPDQFAFNSSILIRDAVERRLGIIGEAAYKLRKLGV